MRLKAALVLLSARFALDDLRRDPRLSACFVLAVTAVLGPLLVLFALRFGLIEAMRDSLRRNPTTLEIRPLMQGRFDTAFFATLARRPGVAYLEPTPRFFATILPLLRDDAAPGTEPVNVDMLPSSFGDPLRAGLPFDVLPGDAAIVSFTTAEALRLNAGDRVQGRFVRVVGDQRQEVSLSMRVLAVLPDAILPREAILVQPAIVTASEDYRNGFAVPLLGADGSPKPANEQPSAGFRLFADNIDHVEPLRAWLVQRGLRVQTAVSEIRLVQNLDTALGLLFAVLAILGGSGAALTMAVSLWANVERKRHEMAVLRLVGFRSFAIAAFPVTQALLIGLVGALLAVAVALLMRSVIEWSLRGTIAATIVAYRLPFWAIAIAVALALLIGGLAAIAASAVAVRVEPAAALRRL